MFAYHSCFLLPGPSGVSLCCIVFTIMHKDLLAVVQQLPLAFLIGKSLIRIYIYSISIARLLSDLDLLLNILGAVQ